MTNKSQNSQSPKDTTSSKKTKTPQWIRDIAAGSNAKEEKSQDAPNISSNIITSGRFSPKNFKEKSKKGTASSDKDIHNKEEDIEKIKKAQKRLIRIEELKQKDVQKEAEMEKSLKSEEEKINKIFNERFK